MNRPRTTMECTPIVVDGVMYITSPSAEGASARGNIRKSAVEFRPVTENRAFEIQALIDPRCESRCDLWQEGDDKRFFYRRFQFDLSGCEDREAIPSSAKKEQWTSEGVGRDSVNSCTTSPLQE